MIEDGLFLGLGFCVAAVIAITLLPLVWARAMRVSRARLVLAMPVSAAEIEAKHDGLRAQAAVAQRRLEQAIEREQEAAARLKVELGHRIVALAAAEQALDALRQEHDALVAEATALARAVRDAEGQRFALEKALHDADWRLDVAVAAAQAAADARTEAGRDSALDQPLHHGSTGARQETRRVAPGQDAEGDAALGPLQRRLGSLQARLLARDGDHPGDAATGDRFDADLRQAIVEIGDEALKLLRPPAEVAPSLSDPDTVQPGGGRP